MLVKHIINKRTEFQKIAMYHDLNQEDAEDIVQDVYYKLCKMEARDGNINRIEWKGELNMVYIFAMIRNAVVDGNKSKKRREKVASNVRHYGKHTSEQPTLLLLDVDKLLQKEGAFYHKLYDAYFNDKISMRKLSSATGIGVQTIYQGVKHIRTKLKRII